MNHAPHRKNAAEWLMWVALQPLRWILLSWSKADARASDPGAPDGR